MNTKTIDIVLEERLRLLDPSLSAGRSSDLYSEVVKNASIKPNSDLGFFSQKISTALEDVYGKGWLINPNITKEVFLQVLYAGLKNGDEAEHPERLSPKSAWRDGSICKFVACESNEIPTGKTIYIRDDASSDQTLKFLDESVRPIETFRVDFSEDLSIEVDEIGRLLYPSHFLDNLFLEERKSTEILLPDSAAKGRAYIVSPSVDTLQEYTHFELGTLTQLRVDKQKNILEFGELVGQQNIEVVSGFILSFNDDKLVNAWLKIENLIGQKPKV